MDEINKATGPEGMTVAREVEDLLTDSATGGPGLAVTVAGSGSG